MSWVPTSKQVASKTPKETKILLEKFEREQRLAGNYKDGVINDIPAGFVDHSEGYYYHPVEKVLLDKQTGKRLLYDEEFDSYYELREGENFDDTISICAEGSSIQEASGKRVIIQDLHKVALAFDKKLGHFDRPSSLFAIFDGNATVATQSAKNLHGKLLDKLGDHRGLWHDNKIKEVLAAVVSDLEAPSTAVLLILGKRLFAAASGNARCIVIPDSAMINGYRTVAREGEDAVRVVTASWPLDKTLSYAALLGSGLPSSELSDKEAYNIFAPHAMSARPHAGAAALVRKAREKSLTEALTCVATVRAKHSEVVQPPSKKPKTDATVGGSVRIRHILLRHVGAKAQAVDPVRKKSTTRTVEEAETALLEALAEVGGPAPVLTTGTAAKDRQSKFTTWVKALSECESAMKGRDFCGDLGWLNPLEINKVLPDPLVKAAYALKVGEVSDIVQTGQGLHLVMRSA